MNRILTARALFVLSGLFIVYATTIPWDVVRAPSFDTVSWLPFWDAARGRIPSLPDIVQNVLLFLPFGFFGWFALDGARKRGGAAGALRIGLVGLGLSLLVEFLQTMSRTRTPSATDMATNFLGAWIGGGLGALYGRHLAARLRAWVGRTVREQPGLLVCTLYLAAVVLSSLAPFLPTLDIGALRQSMRQARGIKRPVRRACAQRFGWRSNDLFDSGHRGAADHLRHVPRLREQIVDAGTPQCRFNR